MHAQGVWVSGRSEHLELAKLSLQLSLLLLPLLSLLPLLPLLCFCYVVMEKGGLVQIMLGRLPQHISNSFLVHAVASQARNPLQLVLQLHEGSY